jgi:hypothetical protein
MDIGGDGDNGTAMIVDKMCRCLINLVWAVTKRDQMSGFLVHQSTFHPAGSGQVRSAAILEDMT